MNVLLWIGAGLAWLLIVYAIAQLVSMNVKADWPRWYEQHKGTHPAEIARAIQEGTPDEH